MDAGLTLVKLIGPITAATVVTVMIVALLWRGHRSEKQYGKPTWQHEAGFVAYMAAIGLFGYLRLDHASTGGLDLFGTAMAGEAFGIVIVYALLHAFVLSRGRPWSERAFPIFAAVMLTGGMLAAVLTT